MSLILEALKRSRGEKARTCAREKSGYALEPVLSALGYSEGENRRAARRFVALIFIATLLAGPALIFVNTDLYKSHELTKFDKSREARVSRSLPQASAPSAMEKATDNPGLESGGPTPESAPPARETDWGNRPPRVGSGKLEAAVPNSGLRPEIPSPKPKILLPERIPLAQVEPAPDASGAGTADGEGEKAGASPPAPLRFAEGGEARAARPPPSDLELAVFYHRGGDIFKASEAYRKVLAADPFNHEAHDNFGLLLQEIGKYDEAIEEHKKAILLRPDSAKAYNNLGFAYLNKGQLSQAQENFERALRLDPYNQAAQNNLALVYLRQGKNEQAKNALIKLLGINPRQPHAHYNLALIYEEEGAVSRAIEHYRSFLEHAGTDAVARSGELLAEVRRRIAELESKKP